MILSLNDEQMLNLWREGAGLEPALVDASIERFDSVNVDGILRRAMRAWYIDWLATAPLDLVPVTDITRFAKIEECPAPGQWSVRLACECARVVTVEIEPYGLIPVLTHAQAGKTDSLLNRFVRRGSLAPCVVMPSANTVILNIDSDRAPLLRKITGVMITEDDDYRVDERVLASIPALAKKALNFPSS